MMYLNNIIFVAMTLFLGFQKSEAQSLLTLDSILIQIEQNHPALKSSDARIQAYNTYAKGAVSLPAPRISGGFWMTPYNPERWKEGMGAFMLSGEQMLPNRSMQQAEGRYMASMASMQTAEKGVMKNMLFSEAKTAYYNWLIVRRKTLVLAESENLLSLMLELAKKRYQYNQESLGSIYKAEAELADLQRMQGMYDKEISQQKTVLKTLMLLPSQSDFNVDTLLKIPSLPISPDTGRVVALSNIKMVEANLQTARLEQEWNRLKLKPEFGIRYDHMIAFGETPWQFSVMGMMTVPIAPWANRDIKARIEGLNAQLSALAFEKEALSHAIQGSATDRLIMMQSLVDQFDAFENNIIPNQHKRFQRTLLAYEQNTEELFMVLDAWLELKKSRLTQLDLLQQFYKTQIEYEKELEIR